MRFYKRRDANDIIIPVYLAATFPGDQVSKLGDIKYVYYPNDNRYAQATGVYAESSGGTITAQPGQSILTIDTSYDQFYYFRLSYNETVAQTIEVVQGNYYFVIPGNIAYISLDTGIIVATLYDIQPGPALDAAATSVLYRSMYGLDIETQ